MRALSEPIEAHVSKAPEAERMRRAHREIDDTAAHEGPSVHDGHDHGSPIPGIRDAELRPARQGSMRSSEAAVA
jgi:hypothetical protein